MHSNGGILLHFAFYIELIHYEVLSIFPTTMSEVEDAQITDRLFTPDRQQRPELWKFIKLVAPTTEKKK